MLATSETIGKNCEQPMDVVFASSAVSFDLSAAQWLHVPIQKTGWALLGPKLILEKSHGWKKLKTIESLS